ncbi:MAG TPA: hypothetical protein PLV21_02295 [Cyclobacteriaceae bacterium]|nr:hypothetical protein [Cyclobacteriaceae bacterium]HRJ80687.1 hypothetical protein [Cyclobacteriaceae bacterium]
MKTKHTTQNEPVWDKHNSTFVRTIFLKNGYTLTGYSKKVGRSERRDKTDLLTNWILRDFSNGYLDKNTQNTKITPLDRIEYYVQSNSEPIIHLYYHYPDWVGPTWMNNKKFYSFISRFYDMIERNQQASAIINALEIRTRASKFDPLDTSRPRFTKMRDLNACVYRLKQEGQFTEEAIDAFYRKYKELYQIQ